MKKIWSLLGKIRKKLTSKNVFLFLGFVIISTVFWLLLSFNNNMTHDTTINVVIKKPSNVTLIQDIPSKITVTLKDRGLSLIKSLFKSTPTIEINFDKYNNEKNNTIEITASQLISEVRNTLGSESAIIKVSPESFSAKYTTLPGKKVPVNWENNIKSIIPDKLFVINPSLIRTNPDSVVVYALDLSTLYKIKEVDISTVEVANLTSTFKKEVRLRSINNVRIVPDEVVLTVPVEPLIKKNYEASISVRNKPNNIDVILDPPSVNVSFLVPQSHYHDQVKLNVIVDWNDIDINSKMVKIKLAEYAGYYSNVTLSADSVNCLFSHDSQNK